MGNKDKQQYSKREKEFRDKGNIGWYGITDFKMGVRESALDMYAEI